MIGLDTNVLVRYFTQDDPEQTPRANAFIDRLTESQPGYLTTVALAETYWVLRRAYKYEKTIIAGVIRRLVESKEIVIEQADAVRQALRRVETGADFADALITELGAAAGCERTVTFDTNAVKAAGMRLLN